jgi:hypothetical protein
MKVQEAKVKFSLIFIIDIFPHKKTTSKILRDNKLSLLLTLELGLEFK